MRRLFLSLLMTVFLLPPVSAQNGNNGEETPVTETFPVALLIDGAEFAAQGALWRPDWPLDFPPDAFKAKEVSRLTVEGEGISLIFYCNTLHSEHEDGSTADLGRVEEFPFLLDGRIAQVHLAYRELFEIQEMVLTFQSGEEPWKFEVLETVDSFPALVRGSRGETWYFIALSRGLNEINETWYDEKGRILGAYSVYLIQVGKDRRPWVVRDYSRPDEDTELHYDSRGLVTESAGPDGIYRVQYFREDLPRYWERRFAEDASADDISKDEAGNFSLQWDERDFLLRAAGESVEFRYEYTLDERGNWIERREWRMIPGLGLLVPTPGTTFTRVLEYPE